MADTNTQPHEHELTLTRIIDAPPEKLFRAWTDPEIMKLWFVPRPWTIADVKTDVRAGGASLIVMKDPDGNEYPNPGVYLEVVPNQKLVFTDAYTSAWRPSARPFMTAIITFEDIGGGKTRYTASALHWSAEDRETHEKMGFHQGWGTCADQLAEVVQTI